MAQEALTTEVSPPRTNCVIESECGLIQSVETDLKTLLMHGTLHTAPNGKNFHQELRDASGHAQVKFQGSSKLHGTKMIIHDSKSHSPAGKVQFESAIRWVPGSKVSLEVLGLAPGSTLLLVLSTAVDNENQELSLPIPEIGVLTASGGTVGLSGCGLALQIDMLDIDRPVADISVLAGSAHDHSVWSTRAACRTTIPEPFLLELEQQAGDVLVTFSDVFMRKVKCPALRVPHLGAEITQAAACPAPALYLGIAASSHGVDVAQVAAAASPPAGVTEEAGHPKPFLCPDGKRFTTRHNAEKWLTKTAASMHKKLGAPTEGDANAVMQHMAAAEAAAQALDAADATAARPAVVISCPQLNLSSSEDTSTVQEEAQLLPLAGRVLGRCAVHMCAAQHRALAEATADRNTPSCGMTMTALQCINNTPTAGFMQLWTDLQSASLWEGGLVPSAVQHVQRMLHAIGQGKSLALDTRHARGEQVWLYHIPQSS